MFDLFVDREVVKLIHILEEPQIVVQLSELLVVLHHFADVEVLVVDLVHVHVLSFGFLNCECWLIERWLENILTVVLNRISRNNYRLILFLVLVFELLCPIVEILPDDIGGLFLVCRLEALLTLNYCKFLSSELLFFSHKAVDVLCSVLDHFHKILDAMFGDGSFFWVVLEGEHLTDDGLLEHLDALQARAGLFQPAAVHD